MGSRADDEMKKKNCKKFNFKGKNNTFFFHNAICNFVRSKHLYDTSSTLFFKIFCSVWIANSFIIDRVHTENR